MSQATAAGTVQRSLDPSPALVRLARPLAFAVTLVLLGIVAVYETIILVQVLPALGQDLPFFRSIAERWLSGGPLYFPHQLAGPYVMAGFVDNLYPPTALLLFVPFVFLPDVLWWAIPLSITGYAIVRWRPAWWAWPLIAAVVIWPKTISSVLWGNTDMWAMAAIAAGLCWGWPAIFLLVKPTLAPLALVASRRRSFWIGAIAMAGVSLVMLPLWFDYASAMSNIRIPWDYSLGSVPVLFLPIVAWVGRRRRVDQGILEPVSSGIASIMRSRAPAVPASVPPFRFPRWRLGQTIE